MLANVQPYFYRLPSGSYCVVEGHMRAAAKHSKLEAFRNYMRQRGARLPL